MTEGPIVILTGAGISAESGLGTFRDADGLWTKYRLEDVATPEGYAKDPALVLDFYNARRENCVGASPNAAHSALARLERARGDVLLVTQNIDDLHERAGCTDVVHMHGEIMAALCARCGNRRPWEGRMCLTDVCPECGMDGRNRPDVVWFGEMPYHLDRIYSAVTNCGLFVAIGTSGSVYPAAGFVSEAAAAGAETLEINLEPSETASRFDRQIYGPATETVPAWVDQLVGG